MKTPLLAVQSAHNPNQSTTTCEPDHLTPLAAATRLGWMPRRNGQPIHVATLYRWDTRGVKGVRLQTVMVGRTRCTTEQALREFFKALAEADMRQMAPVPRPANSRERERAARSARHILNLNVASQQKGDTDEL